MALGEAMQNIREETFQIATLVVVVLTVLVCMAYILIFLNPQVALNPFRPRLPTPTVVLAALQATWTPTRTSTPTETPLPTLTPLATLTPLPTITPSPTRTSTRRPPTRIPRPTVPPVPTSPPYAYRTVYQSCQHAGGTYIEGTVYASSFGVPQAGVRVAMSSGPGPGRAETFYLTSGQQGRSAGYYIFTLAGNGPAPGTYYVWVDNGNGGALSDPFAGRVNTNRSGPDDTGACWRAVVDFVRQ